MATLGHIISNSSDDESDITSRKYSLIGQINNILCNFRNVDCKSKMRLIKSYCTSFYGAELWDLSSNHIDSISIAWRRGIRQIWRVPNTTHSSLLPELCQTLIDLFYKRMLKFIYRCLNSQSFVVNFVIRHSILYCRMNSIVGRNILGCCQRYNTCTDSILACCFNVNSKDCFAGSILDDARHAAAMISELIYCRDGISSMSNSLYDKDDIEHSVVSIAMETLEYFFQQGM
jgi:hypothetical protein